MRWVGSILGLCSLAGCLPACSSSSHDDMPPASTGGMPAVTAPGAGAPSMAGGNVTGAGAGGMVVAPPAAASSGSGAAGSAAGSTAPAPQAGQGAAGSNAATDAGSAIDPGPMVVEVPLPNGAPGIGFDDLVYAPVLKKLLAPAGRTGDLDLVDPVTLEVTAIGGFSMTSMFTLGKHRNGSTSADEGGGRIFAIDNETKTVRVVDPVAKAITFTTTLAAPPDYVRWIETTGEIWVTGPNNPGVMMSANPGIEVFSVPDGAAPVHAALIPISNGPEGMAVDNMRHRVYTDSFRGTTYAVDMMTRQVVETWDNGCPGLTVDLQLDEARGFVMVPCANPGRVAVLDGANGGKLLGELATGTGVDVCAYNPTLHHFYMAGATSADLSIVGISSKGVPTLLGTVPTAMGAQMVAADDRGNAWVGDPAGGKLLKIRDEYPASE